MKLHFQLMLRYAVLIPVAVMESQTKLPSSCDILISLALILL